jgi:hypothetical protein
MAMRNDRRDESETDFNESSDRDRGALEGSEARERIASATPENERAASGAATRSTRARELESSLRDEQADDRGEVL